MKALLFTILTIVLLFTLYMMHLVYVERKRLSRKRYDFRKKLSQRHQERIRRREKMKRMVDELVVPPSDHDDLSAIGRMRYEDGDRFNLQ